MERSEKKLGRIVVNIIKWVAIVYLVIFAPSVIFGIKVGVTITFVVLCLWMAYEAISEHHKRREAHLRNLLRNDGWSEETINHGLEAIDKEQNNR